MTMVVFLYCMLPSGLVEVPFWVLHWPLGFQAAVDGHLCCCFVEILNGEWFAVHRFLGGIIGGHDECFWLMVMFDLDGLGCCNWIGLMAILLLGDG